MAALGAVGLGGCSAISDDSSPTDSPTRSAQTSTPESDPFQAADVHVVTTLEDARWSAKWEEDLVPGFEAAHGSSVAVEHTVEGTRSRVEDLVAAGNPPEVYHATLTGIADFVAAGQTTPVGDLVADLEAANGQLVEPRSVTTDGEVHLVPHGLTLGGVLNYRADVYDELGLSVPETWDDLLANARAIDEAESVDARGFAVSASGSTKSVRDFTNWLYTAGGDYWRWTDETAGTLAVDFQDEHVRAALEFTTELAAYAPDPAETNYLSTIRGWVRGEIAQCLFDNAWLCGAAYRNGAESIALNTQQAVPPVAESGLDPVDRGWVATTGSPIFADADTETAESFVRYMYEGPERQAEMNGVTPMRWLPPYEDVLATEEYRKQDLFQVADGRLLERNRRCVAELAPHFGGDRPRNVAALYAARPRIVRDLVRAVVVRDEAIGDAIARARAELETRLEEGRDVVARSS